MLLRLARGKECSKISLSWIERIFFLSQPPNFPLYPVNLGLMTHVIHQLKWTDCCNSAIHRNSISQGVLSGTEPEMWKHFSTDDWKKSSHNSIFSSVFIHSVSYVLSYIIIHLEYVTDPSTISPETILKCWIPALKKKVNFQFLSFLSSSPHCVLSGINGAVPLLTKLLILFLSVENNKT